ncbi:family 1 glycosylhydrolase [Nocardia sp. CDC160]|uniref:family 1 glycosylhydrolase n=1 Tax=Nocardia sp. CDC160 TaxID=3112166 RepID=UPI002DBE4FDE|nr:family 1 glycosylhydrolase [Nocardia sp. CDC160]MEC3917131.1 family 1 glycosylhydrolase [Nocardia sp. CDC160]
MRTRFRCLVAAGLVAAATLLFVPGAARTAPERPTSVLGDDFLWGVAASGFQSEGQSPDSNWTRYIEANPGWDRLGDSVDFRDRFRSDIALAKDLGVKVFRIGVEWARLEPQPGVWDQAAFDYYDQVVDAIMAAGMRPMLTLDHWVYPGWEADRGGWSNPDMVGDWLTNMRKVVDHFATRNPIWVTINEPVAYIVHEVTLSGTDADEMLHRVAQAHNTIYDYIHQVQPNALVTSNVGYVAGAESQVNGPLMDLIGQKLDFIGIDYYFGYEPPNLAATSPTPTGMWDLPVHPEGIYFALQHYSQRFPGKPLWIVENGIPTQNGTPRPDGYTRSQHLQDTIYWLQRAKSDGMNVIGYNYWSLTDNYEWSSYTPRFGLYTVNASTDPTLTRTPTDAVATYRAIITNDGVPPNYLPSHQPADCNLIDPPASCTTPVTAP